MSEDDPSKYGPQSLDWLQALSALGSGLIGCGCLIILIPILAAILGFVYLLLTSL